LCEKQKVRMIDVKEYGLGYQQLNYDEQFAYELFEEAMRRHAASCDISKIKRSVDIMKVLTVVLGDHPDIIYFNKSMIRTLGTMFSKQMSFVGCLGKRQAEQCEKQLQAALENAVWEIDKGARDDKEILMGISEFLQRNVKYDQNELISSSRGKTKNPMSHNAYGALVNHLAVCDGFSSAYSLIAQYFGIKCMIVEGKSSFHRSSKVEHAWNIVEYQGSYFHIDATWDTNTYETIKTYSYDYFGLDDDEISLDHDWDYKTTPKCDSQKLSYFVSNNLCAYSEAQIEDIMCRYMKNKEKVIRLKVSPSVALPGDIHNYLQEKMKSAAAKSGIFAKFQYTWQETTRCLIISLG